jgi:hypothetical protein
MGMQLMTSAMKLRCALKLAWTSLPSLIQAVAAWRGSRALLVPCMTHAGMRPTMTNPQTPGVL